MAPYISGFEGWLLDLGYTPGTVRGMLKPVGRLGRWMSAQGVGASQLNAGSITAFVSSSRLGGQRQVPTVRSFGPLLEFLGREGVLGAVEVVAPTPVEALTAEYRAWLVHERGLAATTVLRYENLARRFLGERATTAGPRFVEDLSGADVVAFPPGRDDEGLRRGGQGAGGGAPFTAALLVSERPITACFGCGRPSCRRLARHGRADRDGGATYPAAPRLL